MSDQLTTDEGRKRNPRYEVLERAQCFTPADLLECLNDVGQRVADDGDAAKAVREVYKHAMKVVLHAWFETQSDVQGATDRKAIEAVIGTNENPVEGFDADRRLLPHVAVLTRHWEPRTRKRTVSKPTPEERAKLEALLAGTVTEGWDG